MPENWQPTGADRPNVTRTIQYYSLK